MTSSSCFPTVFAICSCFSRIMKRTTTMVTDVNTNKHDPITTNTVLYETL
ncbi:hypothetical protein HanXRQr2_Chr13g0572331 [Helianthus annuus]|uniref:Uncharacterized protein n=1 Tax=Helianthus annuus TaxID=4232 RepID=A0A9K3H9I8_HELAN|nr:hypothetical protein HanXRQr2_Chr13g0572331 [Helianthus annuus]KAJ0847918.1 hypothetical protein HanPSC8_Chr13g0550981 [Helianthus annuus]